MLEPLEELWYRRALDLGWLNEGMPADAVSFAAAVERVNLHLQDQVSIFGYLLPPQRLPDVIIQ